MFIYPYYKIISNVTIVRVSDFAIKKCQKMLQNLIFDSSSDEDDPAAADVYRRRKIYRERINFGFVSAYEFNERFRMSPRKLETLLLEIGPLLAHETKGGALSPKQQISIALHWLGSGSQYHTIADMHGVSKATVCRCLKAVVTAINERLFNTVVSWPENIAAEINRFFNAANFLTFVE